MDRGKGSYWTVNENIDPQTGVLHIWKKKNKSSKAPKITPQKSPMQNTTLQMGTKTMHNWHPSTTIPMFQVVHYNFISNYTTLPKNYHYFRQTWSHNTKFSVSGLNLFLTLCYSISLAPYWHHQHIISPLHLPLPRSCLQRMYNTIHFAPYTPIQL